MVSQLILADATVSDHVDTAKFIANLVVIIGGLGALYYAFKRWVRDVSRKADIVNRKISTPNNHSTIGEQVENINLRFDTVETLVYSNRDTIKEHLKGHP